MTNAIRIIYTGLRPSLLKAADNVNELLATEEFYNNIACLNNFDLADASPQLIADLMRKASIDMTIDLYYAFNPIKNIDSYDDLADPSVIHMNIWKIDRPVASICNALIHSCVHAVNAYHNKYYFGHGDMSLKGKENTAPCKIGVLAEQMISKGMAAYIPFEHDILTSGVKPIKDYLKFD